MPDTPAIASIAALVADPTRATMLTVLMDGRAHTATELALEAGVTASTASSHLSRLTAGRLVSIARQGRHRYFRIPDPSIAAAIEGLMNIAPRAARTRPGPRDEKLRFARVCYDHLAGEAGVRLLEALRARDLVSGADDEMRMTEGGAEWCDRVGIDRATLSATRRKVCRSCLDWSERRTHLAGSLGAAILDRLLALRYAHRERDSRIVTFSRAGEGFLDRLELAR